MRGMRPCFSVAFLYIAAVITQIGASVSQFEEEVLPLLNRPCFQCHGETTQMSDLDLYTTASMVKGGVGGGALQRGSADHSLLYQRALDQSMPMGEIKLSQAELDLLRAWIDAGAPGLIRGLMSNGRQAKARGSSGQGCNPAGGSPAV